MIEAIPLDGIRCSVTGNPYGGDTLAVGTECPCDGCDAGRYVVELRTLLEAAKAHAERYQYVGARIAFEKTEARGLVRNLRAEPYEDAARRAADIAVARWATDAVDGDKTAALLARVYLAGASGDGNNVEGYLRGLGFRDDEPAIVSHTFGVADYDPAKMTGVVSGGPTGLQHIGPDGLTPIVLDGGDDD